MVIRDLSVRGAVVDIGDRRLLTVNEAAGSARVSRRTITLWIQQGRLDTVRTVSGAPRIFADSLFIPARDERIRQSLVLSGKLDALKALQE